MTNKRDKLGKSRLMFPEDYCVFDIETTGLSPSTGEIVEIAAVRYRDFDRVDSFTTFVNPSEPLSDFTIGLTGISNEMLADAPDISKAILDFYDFVQEDILMSYNAVFDIHFLYDALLECHGLYLNNDFVDVLRFARKAMPNFDRRSQTRVADNLRVAHRGGLTAP